MVTLATGIPYPGVGELAYGVGDRMTVGGLYGLTPHVQGYGIRARLIVYQGNENFRIYSCIPVLSYPRPKELGGERRFITGPNRKFEWVTDSSFRYKLGGCITAAASEPALFRNEGTEEGCKGGFWNAPQGVISSPISRIVMFQTEISVVVDGLTLALREWVGGPPLI